MKPGQLGWFGLAMFVSANALICFSDVLLRRDVDKVGQNGINPAAYDQLGSLVITVSLFVMALAVWRSVRAPKLGARPKPIDPLVLRQTWLDGATHVAGNVAPEFHDRLMRDALRNCPHAHPHTHPTEEKR